MALKRQHNALAMYSMASMTDVIFLLLIFFMVTSTFVFPSALEVNLPQSGQQTAIKPSTRVYIDKDLKMYVTQLQPDSTREGALTPMPDDQLLGFFANLAAHDQQQFVALYADEAVPYGKIVEVLDMGSRAGIKVVLATKPAQSLPSQQQPSTDKK